MIEQYDIGGEHGVYLKDGIYSGNWCKLSDVTALEQQHERLKQAAAQMDKILELFDTDDTATGTLQDARAAYQSVPHWRASHD